jgi:hypothetical protein
MSEPLDLSPDDQLAAFKELVQSIGWRLLKAHAAHDWGPEGYGRQMQAALVKVPQGPDRAYELAQVAERVEATSQAVNAVMTYPEEQIRLLSPEKASKRPFNALRRFGS